MEEIPNLSTFLILQIDFLILENEFVILKIQRDFLILKPRAGPGVKRIGLQQR